MSGNLILLHLPVLNERERKGSEKLTKTKRATKI